MNASVIEINLDNVSDNTNIRDGSRRIHQFVENFPGDAGSPLPENESVRYNFFAKGRDFESAFVNHKYTEAEKRILNEYESLDYLPPHSRAYKNWITMQPSRIDWDYWVMMGLIGFLVGFLGFFLHQLIDILAEFKWDRAKKYIKEENILFAWLWVLARSLIGAGCSQLKSSTLGINLPFFKRFRNSEDRRNFISAGAAAGVASAFGSPVGGLLFSMEEVSSFWNMKLSWQTFFCCMISTFTSDLLNSAFTAFHYEGNFGLFKTEKYILFEVAKRIDINIIAVIPAVIVGALGGVIGAVFTFMNLKITRVRRKLLNSINSKQVKTVLQVTEPIIIMI